MSAEFVAHMEEVLDLYEEPYDPRRPVVCFDETSTQLLAQTRPSLPPRPGIPLRQDYEYRRIPSILRVRRQSRYNDSVPVALYGSME